MLGCVDNRPRDQMVRFLSDISFTGPGQIVRSLASDLPTVSCSLDPVLTELMSLQIQSKDRNLQRTTNEKQ